MPPSDQVHADRNPEDQRPLPLSFRAKHFLHHLREGFASIAWGQAKLFDWKNQVAPFKLRRCHYCEQIIDREVPTKLEDHGR